jgi:hypothetical protein
MTPRLHFCNLGLRSEADASVQRRKTRASEDQELGAWYAVSDSPARMEILVNVRTGHETQAHDYNSDGSARRPLCGWPLRAGQVLAEITGWNRVLRLQGIRGLVGGLRRTTSSIPTRSGRTHPNTSKSLSVGDVAADAVFTKAAGCAKSVREECGKDEGEKGDGQSNYTYRTFERKSDTHCDPCHQADWTGII